MRQDRPYRQPHGDDNQRISKSVAFSRGQYREKSHQSAHADKELPPTKIPDHPLIPKAPAKLILAQPDLVELLAHLREEKLFAYDSEFIGELTYHPRLCLVQVATTKQVALIDPLANNIDLRPFWEIVADADVKKIVHAGAQDVEPVVRHLNKEPANIFDTQIAAGFVGYAYPLSLAKLVLELVGVKLSKGLTFTHWDQRPLSEQQMRYAADDVRFLLAIHEGLHKRLVDRGHVAWAEEECRNLCAADRYRFDPLADYLKVRGATGLDPKALAILRELTNWRDIAAKENDVPPRAMLKDEILIDMARNPVKTLDKLLKIKGLPRPVEKRYGTAIMNATNRALAMSGSELPPPRGEEPTPSERFDADAMWTVTQALCAGNGIDPSLVSSRQEIGDLYRLLKTGHAPTTLRLFQGWRRAAVGDPMLALVSGRGGVTLRWTQQGLSVSAQ
jgi:ribonuclease D